MSSDLIFKRSPGTTSSPVTLIFGSGSTPAIEAELLVYLPGPQVVGNISAPHDTIGSFALPGPQPVIQAAPAHNSTLLVYMPGPQVVFEAEIFTQLKVDTTLSMALPGPQVVFYAVEPHDSNADFALPGPTVIWTGEYDSQTARPLVGHFVTSYQEATELVLGVEQVHSTGVQHEAGAEVRFDQATTLNTHMEQPWEEGDGLQADVGASFQRADRLRAAGISTFQQGLITRSSRDTTYQKAVTLAAINCTAFHQVMLMHARPKYTSPWQVAQLLQRYWRVRETDALPFPLQEWLAPFQQAMKPEQGVSFIPFPPRPGHQCYFPPTGRVDFVFKRPYAAPSTTLVFRCDDKPVLPWVIPTKEVYVVKNAVSLTRASDDSPIQLFSATLTTDRNTWTWGLDAQISVFDLDKVEPTVDGPVEVDLVVNGFNWKFLVEDYRDNRVFGSNTVSISGRSVTAVLDEPYARKKTMVQTEPVMSKALAEAVLTHNGVSLGFDLDWALVDVLGWQVPEETWAYQNLTPIQALKAIAEAVGGYLQSHPTNNTLLVRSGYPVKSWAWGAETPDVSMPMDIVLSRSLAWTQKPAYNAIHVSGEKTGYQSMVKIAGTAGDDYAPQYSHPLLSDASALGEYAKCALSAGGKQARMGLTLPLSAETGLIVPGKLVEITGDESWRALSRGISVSISVSEDALEVLQSLELERHYLD